MKSFDFYACTYGNEVYCNGCLPPNIGVDSDEVSPIFADSEWDYTPCCSVCGEPHEYIVLLT